MKSVFFFLTVFILFGCSSESNLDCFKKQGELTTKSINLELFTKINISKDIELIVKQSQDQKVELTMGKNLIDDISFEVIEGELFIANKNSCDLLRNYHPAKVYIHSPNLEKIYSSSQYSIHSEGILNYPNLTLESGIIEDTPASEFNMEIDNQKLVINDNVGSYFNIKGNTQEFIINFWGSNGRLESADFKANQISVFHRSTNDMIVFPIDKISGKIMSTGNLVLKNVPAIIEIEQIYTGHLVFP